MDLLPRGLDPRPEQRRKLAERLLVAHVKKNGLPCDLDIVALAVRLADCFALILNETEDE